MTGSSQGPVSSFINRKTILVRSAIPKFQRRRYGKPQQPLPWLAALQRCIAVRNRVESSISPVAATTRAHDVGSDADDMGLKEAPSGVVRDSARESR